MKQTINIHEAKTRLSQDDIATPQLFPELAIKLTEVFESWFNE